MFILPVAAINLISLLKKHFYQFSLKVELDWCEISSVIISLDNIQTADIDELMQDDTDVNIAEDEGKGQV